VLASTQQPALKGMIPAPHAGRHGDDLATVTVLWIGGGLRSYSPGGRGAGNGARAREQGLLKIEPKTANRRFYTFANAKLGPSPEFQKSEVQLVSRNFLSFRVAWGSEYRLLGLGKWAVAPHEPGLALR
jgi:hypothetical protein